MLTGGTGNDTLNGGAGNDRYQFNYGDGQDVISQYESSGTITDTLAFGAGITLSELSLVKSGNHLIIQLAGSSDQVTLNNWFAHNYYQMDQFELADGTTYSASELLAALPVTSAGTDSNDNLSGYAGVDLMSGGLGNDSLSGDSGNDTLDGGGGNDSLTGSNGDDVLIGGSGNDTLNGGGGNDRYQFGYGDGQDVINNYDTSGAATYTDTLALEAGVSVEDLWFSRNGNHLQVNLVGTDDQMTINNWYSSTNYQLDQVEVGSSVLLNNQVDQLVSAMASYAVPSGAGNIVPQEVKDGLQPILAASWQTL